MNTIQVDLTITPQLLAKMWCKYNAEDQAMFLNEVAAITENWGKERLLKQINAVHDQLTPEAVTFITRLYMNIRLSPASSNLAPWFDYDGNRIKEGDTIIHPDGTEGVVEYIPESLTGDKWFVNYGVDYVKSRLQLQVGDKGRAVLKS